MAPNEKICQDNIFPVTEENYGEQYKEHYLQQFKMYVESVNYTSDLKLRVNRYFLTINTALLAITGFFLNGGELDVSLNSALWNTVIPLSGILLSVIWWAIIYSYKQRNVIKLLNIHCIEQRLPLALYKTEWELMQTDLNSFKKYFFRIDLFTPWVFVMLYVLLLLFF